MKRFKTAAHSEETLASDILLAILVNLKRLSGKKQLFVDADYDKFQEIFWLLRATHSPFLDKYFVFSDSGPSNFSPALQKSFEELQLSGCISWPDLVNDGSIMRLNLSAERFYDEEIAVSSSGRLPFKDIYETKRVAATINTVFSNLIVDRPHLTNC